MKHPILLAVFLLSFSSICAQDRSTTNFDSLAIVLQQSVQKQDSAIRTLQNQNAGLQQQVQQLDFTNAQQSSQLLQQQTKIDSLAELISINTQDIQITAKELGLQINETNSQGNSNANNLKLSIILGSIVALSILIISILLTVLLHKLGSKSVIKLKEQTYQLNEKIISQLTDETAELQKISDALQSTTGSHSNSEDKNNHDLVKALADRITFMEMTLYKMDSSVRGHKHLSRTIEQMKNNMLAYGYEIVSMLGKEYNDGMKVTASFVEDDNIEQGKQIITGIIKPQINFNGTMIQSAQITVSQNI